MFLETAVPLAEDDSRSDAHYHDEKNTLTNSSTRSTYSITIAHSSDKPKKNEKIVLSFKQAKKEQEPILNDVMESINNLSIEIKKMTSRHNKMENVLNDRKQAKALERIKKVENINEIMEVTDLRCKPCFKLHEISKPHISTLAQLRAQRILNSFSSGTLATGIFFTKDQTSELITGKNHYCYKQKNSCIYHICLTGHGSKTDKQAMDEYKKECKNESRQNQVTKNIFRVAITDLKFGAASKHFHKLLSLLACCATEINIGHS